jgi:hypothetical protein
MKNNEGKNQELDKQDIEMLSLIATMVTKDEPEISSWALCKRLYPEEKNPQNHLSSVIWRLDKNVSLGFLKEHPHPTRDNRKVYSLPDYAFSVDGTVFIPSPVGGLILNCTYRKDGCNPCKFGGKSCKLVKAILNDGLETVLGIAERFTKLNMEDTKQNVSSSKT